MPPAAFQHAFGLQNGLPTAIPDNEARTTKNERKGVDCDVLGPPWSQRSFLHGAGAKQPDLTENWSRGTNFLTVFFRRLSPAARENQFKLNPGRNLI